MNLWPKKRIPVLRPMALEEKFRPDGSPLVDEFQGCNPLEDENSQRLGGPWGNVISKKKDERTIRIALINVNGLTPEKSDIKTNKFKKFIKDKSVNILCINEHNLNLPKLGAQEG